MARIRTFGPSGQSTTKNDGHLTADRNMDIDEEYGLITTTTNYTTRCLGQESKYCL